jgi:hypothetical protein
MLGLINVGYFLRNDFAKTSLLPALLAYNNKVLWVFNHMHKCFFADVKPERRMEIRLIEYIVAMIVEAEVPLESLNGLVTETMEIKVGDKYCIIKKVEGENTIIPDFNIIYTIEHSTFIDQEEFIRSCRNSYFKVRLDGLQQAYTIHKRKEESLRNIELSKGIINTFCVLSDEITALNLQRIQFHNQMIEEFRQKKENRIRKRIQESDEQRIKKDKMAHKYLSLSGITIEKAKAKLNDRAKKWSGYKDTLFKPIDLSGIKMVKEQDWNSMIKLVQSAFLDIHDGSCLKRIMRHEDVELFKDIAHTYTLYSGQHLKEFLSDLDSTTKQSCGYSETYIDINKNKYNFALAFPK